MINTLVPLFLSSIKSSRIIKRTWICTYQDRKNGMNWITGDAIKETHASHCQPLSLRISACCFPISRFHSSARLLCRGNILHLDGRGPWQLPVTVVCTGISLAPLPALFHHLHHLPTASNEASLPPAPIAHKNHVKWGHLHWSSNHARLPSPSPHPSTTSTNMLQTNIRSEWNRWYKSIIASSNATWLSTIRSVAYLPCGYTVTWWPHVDGSQHVQLQRGPQCLTLLQGTCYLWTWYMRFAKHHCDATQIYGMCSISLWTDLIPHRQSAPSVSGTRTTCVKNFVKNSGLCLGLHFYLGHSVTPNVQCWTFKSSTYRLNLLHIVIRDPSVMHSTSIHSARKLWWI